MPCKSIQASLTNRLTIQLAEFFYEKMYYFLDWSG